MTAACGGPVEITERDLSASDEAACEAFVESLPDTLAEQGRVESEGGYGAAYGDPPIVVSCGVEQVDDFGPGAPCEIAEGVRWHIPVEQLGNEPRELTYTSAWDTPHVQVEVPAAYWPEGGAAVMAVLAPLVDEHLAAQPGDCL